jgi:hypothetical protein
MLILPSLTFILRRSSSYGIQACAYELGYAVQADSQASCLTGTSTTTPRSCWDVSHTYNVR